MTAKSRHIRKAAVLGSGVMGSQIACHLANIGVEVLLLDILPRELTDEDRAKGWTETSKAWRNKIVQHHFEAAKKLKPAPLYHSGFADRIRIGNFEDDLPLVAEADWIIEAVIERRDIKLKVYESIEKHRKPGTLVSTNTSGIPINSLLEGRSEDFKRHFLGTHFFNPPRYLKLLEIIPSKETAPEVQEFFMEYGRKFLGKDTVACPDTPAFIANRIGVFSIMHLFHLVQELGLTVEQVDKLTGPVIGRPKSATFRTADVVGLDTLINVAQGLAGHLQGSEEAKVFALPPFLEHMQAQGWLGQKSGQGFYKKVKDSDGGSQIHALDLKTLAYRPSERVKFASLEAAKPMEDLRERMRFLLSAKDEAGNFYRKSTFALLHYAAGRIPESAEACYKIDQALKAGFGWQLGPFELWDALGMERVLEGVEKEGLRLPDWVSQMHKEGAKSFYRLKNNKKEYWDIHQKAYAEIPGQEAFLLLENLEEHRLVWKNKGCSLYDIGDGVLNLAFHTKMNSIGSEVLQGLQHSIDVAEKEGWNGLVIANEGEQFSAGANLALILMLAIEQEWDELSFAVQAFQKSTMRVRYSDIPVVVAPHGLTLGGGCELCLHADAVVAAAETYIGLVEVGVGLIPGGGGTKEFALRASDAYREGGIRTNVLRERFLTMGQAKVATSAKEAFDLGIFVEGRDQIAWHGDRRIALAKQKVLQLHEAGYTRPIPRKDITVLGQEGLGIVYAGANAMKAGHYISEHDQVISEKLGYVMCGGDLSQAQQVDEQYLLDLEREAFLSLLSTKATLERIQHMLKTGKPLRN